MPLFIIFIGAVLIAAGLNDKLSDLRELLREDFKGTANIPGFPSYAVAVIALAAIGYYKPLRPFSMGILFLAFVAVFVAKSGFYTKFTTAIKGI